MIIMALDARNEHDRQVIRNIVDERLREIANKVYFVVLIAAFLYGVWHIFS